MILFLICFTPSSWQSYSIPELTTSWRHIQSERFGEREKRDDVQQTRRRRRRRWLYYLFYFWNATKLELRARANSSLLRYAPSSLQWSWPAWRWFENKRHLTSKKASAIGKLLCKLKHLICFRLKKLEYKIKWLSSFVDHSLYSWLVVSMKNDENKFKFFQYNRLIACN